MAHVGSKSGLAVFDIDPSVVPERARSIAEGAHN